MEADLKTLAVVGAQVRLKELDAERSGLLAFIGGKSLTTRAKVNGHQPPRKRGGRRPMSAAMRKQVSLRMKKRWAVYRANKAAAGR